MTLHELETYARFVITAHRGDLNPVDGWPEGTLEGYRQAVRKGCQRVDLDVRLSASGTFYVMHDSTVTRTTNGSGALEGKTDAQIDALVIDGGLGYKASLHAGLNLRVPKLLDVVQALDNYRIVFHFDQKDVGDAAVSTALAAFIVANGLVNTCFVSGGNLAALQSVHSGITNNGGPGDWVPAEDYGAVDEAALTRQAWADGLFSFTVNDVDAGLAVRKNLLSTCVRILQDGVEVGYASEIDIRGAESVVVNGQRAVVSFECPAPAVPPLPYEQIGGAGALAIFTGAAYPGEIYPGEYSAVGV